MEKRGNVWKPTSKYILDSPKIIHKIYCVLTVPVNNVRALLISGLKTGGEGAY